MTLARRFPTAEALGDALAREILDGIDDAGRRGGRYVLGCPGGRSARSTYQALARLAQGTDLRHVVIVMMDEYLVEDMNAPSPSADACLRALRPNALACVAALGFGDIPARAWHRAAGYVAPGGLLAFNIKDDFLDPRYAYGFSELIRRMVNGKVARMEAMRRYRHRLSAAGEPIYYTAMVVTKLAEIPASMLVDG